MKNKIVLKNKKEVKLRKVELEVGTVWFGPIFTSNRNWNRHYSSSPIRFNFDEINYKTNSVFFPIISVLDQNFVFLQNPTKNVIFWV